jgi:hypothetical protein
VGTIEFRLRRRKIVARAGDVVTVEPGSVHSFRNAGEDEGRFVTEVSPALRFESFLETIFGLGPTGTRHLSGSLTEKRPRRMISAAATLVRSKRP